MFFPRCTAGPKLVGSCCIRLHTTTNTHATTPNIVCATILGVVASVCTQPKAQVYKETLKHVHQLSTLLIVIRFLSSLSLILSVNKVRLIILYGGEYWTKMELNKFISNRVMHYIVPCGDIPSKTTNFSVNRYTIPDTSCYCIGHAPTSYRMLL